MIRVLAIGAKHDSDIIDAISKYEKRLRAPYDITWQLLPHSKKEGDAARLEETELLLAKISSDDTVILLDERGLMITSPQLAHALEVGFSQGKKITVVIGGAYGVSPALHRRAQYVLALSKLVFPHQLVRLLVTEQLYRAQEINAGKPYHHK